MDQQLNHKKKRISIFHNNIFSKAPTVLHKVPLHISLNNDASIVLDHSVNDSYQDRRSSISFNKKDSLRSQNKRKIFSMRKNYMNRTGTLSSFQKSVECSSISSLSRHRNHKIFESREKTKVYLGQTHNHMKNDYNLKMRKQYSYQPNASIIVQNQDQLKQSVFINVPKKQMRPYQQTKKVSSAGVEQKLQGKDDGILKPEQFAKLLKGARCKPKLKHNNVKKTYVSSGSTNNNPHSPFVTKFQYLCHYKI